MKKLIILLTIISFGYNTSAQDTSALATQKAYYLQKATKQKTTGFILLGTGAAAIIVGGILINQGNNQDEFMGGLDDWAYGTGLMIGGGVVMATSIPFFISSGNNKSRAAAITVGIQPVYLPRNNTAGLQYAPALSFTIGL